MRMMSVAKIGAVLITGVTLSACVADGGYYGYAETYTYAPPPPPPVVYTVPPSYYGPPPMRYYDRPYRHYDRPYRRDRYWRGGY